MLFGDNYMVERTRLFLKCLSRSSRPVEIISNSSLKQDKNDSFRLMGFGHRVYKNFDPSEDHQEGV